MQRELKGTSGELNSALKKTCKIIITGGTLHYFAFYSACVDSFLKQFADYVISSVTVKES